MASIRKRAWKTAKGEARIAWCIDFTDANGVRQRRHFKTKHQANDFRVEIEGQLRAGTFRPDAAKVRVYDACEAFLDYCRGRMERGERMTPHNLKVYEGHIYNYVCPDPERHAEGKRPSRLRPFTAGVSTVKLGQLTARTVSDFRDRLRDAGVTVTTTRKILGTLQCVLQHAISRDLIAVNAARGVKVIGRREEGARKVIPPTKEAMKALIEAANPDFGVKLIVASATGLRAGEVHALRWHHLDLDKGEMTVETRVDVYGNEDATKTAAGMRTIPLGWTVVTVLKAWRLRSRFGRPDDLVFPNRRGGYGCHANMIKRDFNPLFARLDAAHKENPTENPKVERFNWHGLRHFAISTWIEAGLSPKTVQTFAGHSSLQMTMDRYGHHFKSEDHKRAMDEIARGLYS